MLSNYFKLAFRNLLKNPQFTALNVLGLSLGLAVSLLLLHHVRDERSFDRFHSKADRIYRVLLRPNSEGGVPEEAYATCPNSVAPVMRDNITAVEQSARLLLHNFGESAFVFVGDQEFVEQKLYWADAGLLETFDFQMLAGNAKTALTEPNSILLSRSVAQRYFGTSAAVGQTLRVDNMDALQVTGVFEDLPGNSTLDADLIGSFGSVKWAKQNLTWDNASFETWLLLRPDATPKQVEQQMAALVEKNVPPDRKWFSLGLQALPDVHLGSVNIQNSYSSRVGDPQQVGILAGLALAVLLIACFNYMNLSTARSQLRFREVGISKTLGAARSQLSTRFFIETGVLVGISLFLAFGLLRLALPLFNNLTEKNTPFASFFQPEILLGVAGLGLLVTLIAGSYPAFFLSSFMPKNLLQTAFRSDTGAGWMRRSLVVTQFAVATALIVGTVVLYRQMQFVQQKSLGFEPDQVVAITVKTAKDKAQRLALLQEVSTLSAVQATTFSQTFPGRGGSGRTLLRSETDNGGATLTTCRAWPDFEKVLDISLVAGRSITPKADDDTTAQVVLNRAAVAYLGLTPEQALGKRIECQLGPAAFVVGVTEDFHAASLHQPIEPYAFHNFPSEGTGFMLVKLQTQDLPSTMRQLEAATVKVLPNVPFEYVFLDEHIDKLYRTEQRTAQIALIFSTLAILISCLGLFGLAAFTAERRRKEIGIRKVMGASVAGITGLLAKDFLKLVAVSFLVAWPISYWAMSRWLADFAYRIDLSWWMFAIAGAAAVAIAFLTVGTQSMRAALTNPIDSLRSE